MDRCPIWPQISPLLPNAGIVLTLILVAPLTDFSKELMAADCVWGWYSRFFGLAGLRDNRQVDG
ncbi:uncharacterized protein TrAtP1_006751 [Trichoderma atroviride]|uniref:uncharacterized protein n=1 Tax=Hypocrea atroviridis TaxID=63577 RepID=UPI003323B3C7|nr:hypothetical protein TrAtP1_006751 [Trichoderma atroviride]